MVKNGKNKNVRNVCQVCGKTFFSAKDATVCISPSTCRVKLSQQKKAQQKLAEQFTMDLDGYATYQRLVNRYPQIKTKLDVLIFQIGALHSSNAISIMWDICVGEWQTRTREKTDENPIT